jgi:D-threo-aldose 1-dehydrogenase
VSGALLDDRRPIGTTGFSVPPLCIGMAEIGSPLVPEDQALGLVRAVLDGPVRFLDTSASYGDGESERRIGRVLRERGGVPDGFLLATKADRNLQTHDFSGDQARRSVERSLQLLGLEQLPLVYLHDPEYSVQSFEEITGPGGAVEALLDLQRQGIVGQVGFASGPADLVTRYVETDAFVAAIIHNRYTLLERSAEMLFPVAAARHVAVLNAAPYGGGLLAKGPRDDPRYMYRPASAVFLERVRRMADICGRYEVPLAAAALQFSLREPRVTSTIVGFSHAARLRHTLELASLPIPDALWAELETIAAA